MYKKFIIPISKCISLTPNLINNNRIEKVSYSTKTLEIKSNMTDFSSEGLSTKPNESISEIPDYDVLFNDSPYLINNDVPYEVLLANGVIEKHYDEEGHYLEYYYSIEGYKYPIYRSNDKYWRGMVSVSGSNGITATRDGIEHYFYFKYDLDISNMTLLRDFNFTNDYKIIVKNKMTLGILRDYTGAENPNRTIKTIDIEYEIGDSPTYEFVVNSNGTDNYIYKLKYSITEDISTGKCILSFYVPIKREVAYKVDGNLYGLCYQAVVLNEITILLPKMQLNDNETNVVGNENSELEYTINSSDLMLEDNYYRVDNENHIPIGQYISNQILDNYSKSKMTFEADVIVCNYYNENNELVIDKEKGEIISVGDIVKFKNNKDVDNKFFDKEYLITDTEFTYNGVPKMHIKGKEV